MQAPLTMLLWAVVIVVIAAACFYVVDRSGLGEPAWFIKVAIAVVAVIALLMLLFGGVPSLR